MRHKDTLGDPFLQSIVRTIKSTKGIPKMGIPQK